MLNIYNAGYKYIVFTRRVSFENCINNVGCGLKWVMQGFWKKIHDLKLEVV